MRHAILVSVVAVAAAVALRTSADDTKAVRMWNPATVSTVAGTVEAVERVEMGAGWRCLRLRLGTAEGPLLVRVGPDWFLEERRLSFAVGDRLRVTGSRLTFSGEATVIAGEIVRGSERMILRDGAGSPAWAGK